jgi:hypothetical protein
MIEQLLTPAYMPFAISFVVMLGIGLIEAIGLGLGHIDVDSGLGADGADTPGITLLDWLGIGEIPILIWLTSFLACFTVIGIAIQQIAAASVARPWRPGLLVAAHCLAG